MTEHDMKVGPCACGAWHEDGEMTEKPPVPSEAELREMRRQAVAYYWADGHFADWVETGEVTDRPDTWDKDLEPLYELLQKQWLAGYHARDGEVASLQPAAMSKFYAELKSRIAELEADELETQRQLDNERINHEATAKYCVELQNRVTELEAEVAELRASQALVRKLVTEYSHHISPAIRETLSAKVSAVAPRSSLPDGAVCTVCGCEKRDHELPLRSSSCFAFTVLPAAPRRTPELTERVASWVLQRFYDGNNLMRDTARLTAGALLDIVFGKQRQPDASGSRDRKEEE